MVILRCLYVTFINTCICLSYLRMSNHKGNQFSNVGLNSQVKALLVKGVFTIIGLGCTYQLEKCSVHISGHLEICSIIKLSVKRFKTDVDRLHICQIIIFT